MLDSDFDKPMKHDLTTGEDFLKRVGARGMKEFKFV